MMNEKNEICLQDTELAITLLYQLGEGAVEETLKPGSGALGQLAIGEASPNHGYHDRHRTYSGQVWDPATYV